MAGGEVIGPPYQAAARLAATAVARWAELDGKAVQAGFDPLKLPPDRFFNWVWFLLIDGLDEKDVQDVEIQVYRPLPGQQEATTGPWSDEAMAASFKAAAAQIG